MDPDFEPTYTMYCGDGGDGGGSGGGDASSPGDTGGAGGDDGAGGNDAGGASGGTSGGDAPSPGDTGGAGGNPSDPGSEASGGGGGSTDTGDMGSEAANVAATESANASVGAGGSGVSGGFAPSPAEVSLADISADEAAAAGLGVTAVDPGIPTETIKSYTQNLQAQMKSNPMAMVAAQTIAANTMMGGIGTGTSTSVGSSTDPFGTISGGGDADTLTATIAPYLLGNTQAQPSQVLQYFSNLQNQPQTDGLLSRYDQAKQNISGILGTNNQLGASNTSNFYYNYLNQRGLL
jgi:hypothetical protein